MHQRLPGGRGGLLAALALLVSLAVAAPAGAIPVPRVTSSHISSYSGSTFESLNADLGPTDSSNLRTVSGIAETTGAGAAIEVRCYSADDTSVFLLGSGTVNPDGTFSVTGSIPGQLDPCWLYAVDAGAADHSGAVQGPVIYPGRRSTSSGPGGVLSDWFVSSQPEKHGYADFNSLGHGGLYDMFWRDDTGGRSQYLWYENDSIDDTYSYGPDAVPYATVDGQHVWAPHTVAHAISASAPGFLPLTFDYGLDGGSGDVTVKSTEPLMTCPSDPTTIDVSSCPEFGDSGLRVERTIRYDHEGQVWRATDLIRNVAGADRSFDIRLLNSQDYGGPGNGMQLAGEPGFSTFADRGNAPTTIDGPSSAISTMYVKYDGSADIDPLSNPVGSLTVSPAPAEVIFRNGTEFLLRYTGTIPAGGSNTITHVYTMGGSLAATQALASEAEDSLAGPSVAITSPDDGAKVSSPDVTVSGTASDNKGVSSLKVNGTSVTVGSDAKWSAKLSLSEGENTITAVGADATGNTATASRKVTYTKPAVTTTLTPPPLPKSPTVSRGHTASTSVSGTTITVDTGQTVTCPPGGPACSATVTLTTLNAYSAKAHKRKQTLGKATLTVTAGKTVKVRVKLTKAGAKLLRRQHKLRVVVTTISRAGTGAPQTVKKPITIKAPKKAKHAHRKVAHGKKH